MIDKFPDIIKKLKFLRFKQITLSKTKICYVWGNGEIFFTLYHCYDEKHVLRLYKGHMNMYDDIIYDKFLEYRNINQINTIALNLIDINISNDLYIKSENRIGKISGLLTSK